MIGNKVGARVILNSLLKEGDFAGEIIAIDEFSDLCTVKLDIQDAPVTGVLWFNEMPEVVDSVLWQICYSLSVASKCESNDEIGSE